MSVNTQPTITTSSTNLSCFLPSFLKRIADPDIKTVMLCGCGGGFDFVHSISLYPELQRLGKTVIIASYSFGIVANIQGEAPVFWKTDEVECKLVSSKSIPHERYGPEVHVCAFLDEKFPNSDSTPHTIYAMYARSFTVPLLTSLYTTIIQKHSVDAILAVDGGSDSLMAGDEQGLGDPIEDAVSICTVANLAIPTLKFRALLCMGVGCDRHNTVSDASTFRAISEITRLGGFLGCVSLEPHSIPCSFYRDLLNYMYQKQTFHSVIAGSILASAEGYYGTDNLPKNLSDRVGTDNKTLFLWPIMSMIWAFDIQIVAKRSLTVNAIKECKSIPELHEKLYVMRNDLPLIRDVENLPRQEEFSCDGGHNWLSQQQKQPEKKPSEKQNEQQSQSTNEHSQEEGNCVLC